MSHTHAAGVRSAIASTVVVLLVALLATPASAAVPDAPTITGVTPGNASISVAFTPGGDGGFPILTFTASCTSNNGGAAGSATGVGSPLTVSSLTNGKTYTCTVTATNVFGASAPSAASSAVVPATAPDAPAITGVTAGNASISVAFTPGADGGAAVSSFGASCTSLDGGSPGSSSGAGSPLTVSSLTNGKTYTCTVTATNEKGTSAASTPSGPAIPGSVPDAPTITGVTAGNASISVAFTPGANGGVAVSAFTASCTSSNGGAAGSATGAGSPLTVASLTNGKTYTCTVTATNVFGTSAPSAPSDPVVPVTVPSAPTITAVTPGGGSLMVTFTPGSDGGSAITSFEASCTSGNGGASGLASGPTSPITVSSVTNGKIYTCTVTATNAQGDGPASAPSAPVIPGAAPDSPTITGVTRGDGQVSVAFAPGADNGYAILAFSADCTSTNGGAAGSATDVSSPIAVTGLSNGKTYTCTVAAINAQGTGDPSDPSEPIVPARVPDAPVVSSVARGNAQISVAFAAGADGGSAITSFTASCTSSNGGATGSASGAGSPLVVTPLTNGKTYTCTVTATNDVGTSAPSGASAAIVPGAVPDPPTITSAARGNGQITVAFAPGPDNGFAISGFTASCTSTNGGTAGSRTGAASPLVVTGLTNGKTYTCTVTATNELGTSAPSAPSAAVVPATLPGAPTGVTGARGNASIVVSFTPGGDGGSPVTAFNASCTSSDGGVARTRSGPSSPVTVTSLTNRKTYTCTVTATNGVGTGPASAPTGPVVPDAPLASVAEISAGDNHTCARLSDGTARCWGVNASGQLGDGTTTTRLRPVVVLNPAGTGPLTGVAQISTGTAHTCAVLTDATIRCWGSNAKGQLGDGTTTTRLLPVTVKNGTTGGSLTSVTKVSASGDYSCARMSSSTARCWGYNGGGQLGDGTTVNRLLSVAVKNEAGSGSLTGISTVVARGSHTCARMGEGTARCWGLNSSGEVGDGTTTRRLLPVVVKSPAGTGSLTSVSEIDAGSLHSCARLTTGEMRCWGSNASGQLGDGTTTTRLLPVTVKGPTGAGVLSAVTQISARGVSSCARISDGTARCWGNNTGGRLGDGTSVNLVLPSLVMNEAGTAPLVGVTQVSARVHACARMSDATARCWGPNASGQIGDGTTAGRLLPTLVLAP